MEKIEKIFLDCSPEKALEIFNDTKLILSSTKIRFLASKHLSSSYIQMTPELFSQHVRYQSTVQIKDLSFTVIGESIIFRQEPLIVWTCCYKVKDAVNIASSLLIDKIIAIDPNLNMPHYLIGLPNLRGHCFFVPVLVPLFNNKDFVDALFAAFDICEIQINEKKLVKPETNLAKMLIERDSEKLFESLPFLWSRVIKQLYLQYRKASAYGQLYILNKPKGIEFAYPEIYADYLNAILDDQRVDEADELMDCSEQLNYKLDLRLDRKLIKLIRELAEFQSDLYKTPGGYATKLYRDIIENLNLEFVAVPCVSPYYDVFYLRIEYDYVCIKCRYSGYLKNRVEQTAITVPAKHKRYKSLQEILDDPEELTKYDNAHCKEYKFGSTCYSKILLKEHFTITKLPKILAFTVCEGENCSRDFLQFPDEILLKLGTDKEKTLYYKGSYSIDFELWKDEEGRLRSDREIAPEEGDVSAGYHVAAFLKTNQGWMEVNNSNVYPLEKIHSTLKPGSLVFYFMKKERNFNPNVFQSSGKGN